MLKEFCACPGLPAASSMAAGSATAPGLRQRPSLACLKGTKKQASCNGGIHEMLRDRAILKFPLCSDNVAQ